MQDDDVDQGPARPDGWSAPGLTVAPGPHPGTPKSIMDSSPIEYRGLKLKVLAGQLPADLRGHIFVSGPRVHTGTPVLSSNGITYRIDLDEAGVSITSAATRTASWYVHRAVNQLKYLKRPLVDHRVHQFRTDGLGQMSLTLGAQELPNTAPVFIPVSGRMIVTTDAGRPWQIDPYSLRPITPIGYRSEYKPALPAPWMLPLLQTTAHATVDAHSGDLYCSNHSPKTLLTRPFTHLCRWRERDPRVRHWRLIDPKTQGDVAMQTLHQLAITREHVVMLDSDFPVNLIEAIAALFHPWVPLPPLLVERLVARQTSAVATVWVVKKSDLVDSEASLNPEDPPRIYAQRFTLGPGGLHIAVDEDDSEGKIKLVMTHTPSEDLTHVLREGERLVNGDRVPAWADGMLTPVPIIRGMMGVHELELGNNAVRSRFYADDRFTWGIAVYTHPGFRQGEITRTKNIWLNAGGFTADQLPVSFYNLYKDRAGPLESLPIEQGIPASVFRFNTETGAFDGHNVPAGWYCFAPTYVRSARPEVDREDGYVVVMNLSDPSTQLPEGSSGDELWVYLAQDMARGPICRLGHPELKFGMTLHSMWTPRLPPAPLNNQVNIKEDLNINTIKEQYNRFFGGECTPLWRLLTAPLRAAVNYAMDFEDLETMLIEQVYPYFDTPGLSRASTISAEESTAGIPGPGWVPSPTR